MREILGCYLKFWKNAYKDDFIGSIHEFAQTNGTYFLPIGLNRIHHPNFGVNYDLAIPFLAGEDPLELLYVCPDRVIVDHAR